MKMVDVDQMVKKLEKSKCAHPSVAKKVLSDKVHLDEQKRLVEKVINDSNVKLPKLKTVLTNAAAVVKKADEALKLANSACTAVSGLMASE